MNSHAGFFVTATYFGSVTSPAFFYTGKCAGRTSTGRPSGSDSVTLIRVFGACGIRRRYASGISERHIPDAHGQD